MKVARTAVGAVALAGAASMALATGASAVTVHGPGTVVDEVPTHNLEMCGNVYEAPDSAVEGATITGNLYDSDDQYVDGPYSDTTNDGGGWCIRGNANLAATIYDGGYVTVCVDPDSVNGKSFDFLGSGSNCADIDEETFDSYKYVDLGNLILASAKDLDAVA